MRSKPTWVWFTRSGVNTPLNSGTLDQMTQLQPTFSPVFPLPLLLSSCIVPNKRGINEHTSQWFFKRLEHTGAAGVGSRGNSCWGWQQVKVELHDLCCIFLFFLLMDWYRCGGKLYTVFIWLLSVRTYQIKNHKWRWRSQKEKASTMCALFAVIHDSLSSHRERRQPRL